jgi:hypothetical protein
MAYFASIIGDDEADRESQSSDRGDDRPDANDRRPS